MGQGGGQLGRDGIQPGMGQGWRTPELNGAAGQGQNHSWACASTEPVREPNTGTATSSQLRLEVMWQDLHSHPPGAEVLQCGLLDLLPFTLTFHCPFFHLSHIFPAGHLLLISCDQLKFVEAAAAREDLHSWEVAAPSLHRLWEKFRFSSVLQAIRKGTGNYALMSKYISECSICFVQVSLVY